LRFFRILGIIRVHIVLGGLLAFSLGSLIGVAEGGSFDTVRFILCYLVVLLGDLSTHYSNDFFDVEIDRHTRREKLFGGSKILIHNPDLRSLAKSVSVSLLIFSNLLSIGLVLFLAVPTEFSVVFFAASLVGWVYSAPPLRLASRGFGEVVVAWVTGFAIPGMGYLSVRGQFDTLFLLFTVPFVMYGLILSFSLEVPDVEVDQKGRKRNLAVRIGTRKVFSFILALAFASTIVFSAYTWLVSSLTVNIMFLAGFSIVPLAAAILGRVGVTQKRSVNPLSAINIVALFVFNLLAIGYLLAVSLTT